jgi:hypothetical protein
MKIITSSYLHMPNHVQGVLDSKKAIAKSAMAIAITCGSTIALQATCSCNTLPFIPPN